MRALSGLIFRHDKSPTSTGSVEDPSASRQLNNRYGQKASAYPKIWFGRFQSARDVKRSISDLPTMLGRERFFRRSRYVRASAPAATEDAASVSFPTLDSQFSIVSSPAKAGDPVTRSTSIEM